MSAEPGGLPIAHAIRIVLVRWLDTTAFHGWADLKERLADVADLDHRECVSAGFLLGDDDGGLTLAESLSGCGNVGCTMWIPRCAVRSVETLRELVRGRQAGG